MLFGSTAMGAKGRDIDLAVLPDAVPDLLRQGQWQASLETHFSPRAVDLLLLTPATSPVTRFEVFRAGRDRPVRPGIRRGEGQGELGERAAVDRHEHRPGEVGGLDVGTGDDDRPVLALEQVLDDAAEEGRTDV